MGRWVDIWAAGVAVNTMCIQHGFTGKGVWLGKSHEVYRTLFPLLKVQIKIQKPSRNVRRMVELTGYIRSKRTDFHLPGRSRNRNTTEYLCWRGLQLNVDILIGCTLLLAYHVPLKITSQISSLDINGRPANLSLYLVPCHVPHNLETRVETYILHTPSSFYPSNTPIMSPGKIPPKLSSSLSPPSLSLSLSIAPVPSLIPHLYLLAPGLTVFARLSLCASRMVC